MNKQARLEAIRGECQDIVDGLGDGQVSEAVLSRIETLESEHDEIVAELAESEWNGRCHRTLAHPAGTGPAHRTQSAQRPGVSLHLSREPTTATDRTPLPHDGGHVRPARINTRRLAIAGGVSVGHCTRLQRRASRPNGHDRHQRQRRRLLCAVAVFGRLVGWRLKQKSCGHGRPCCPCKRAVCRLRPSMAAITPATFTA